MKLPTFSLPFVVVALAAACGDASDPGDSHRWPVQELESTEAPPEVVNALGFGWRREVTASSFDPAAATRLGSATHPLEGNTLRAIVTQADVRVRSDDLPCTDCHSWAPTIDRASFCLRVDAFLALPTSKEDGADPPSSKPAILQRLFSEWRDAGCPD